MSYMIFDLYLTLKTHILCAQLTASFCSQLLHLDPIASFGPRGTKLSLHIHYMVFGHDYVDDTHPEKLSSCTTENNFE